MILISRLTIDSSSTASYIHKTLSELEDFMVSVESNVTAFSEFVRLQMDALTARGESSNDVIVSLFKGYPVPDKEFSTYIKQKKYDYEDGQYLSESLLMNMAENKYKGLVHTGEWNAPSKEQKEILELIAKLEYDKEEESDSNSKRSLNMNGRNLHPSIQMRERSLMEKCV